MGGPSGTEEDDGTRRGWILLATEEGYCGTLCEDLSCLPENKQSAGLLQPLPIPERPWDSVSLDFISALPKSERFGLIMVIVDRFSKYGKFVTSDRDCTVEEAAMAFFKNVVKLWGLPRNIVSDWDPRFTGRLWTELFKMWAPNLASQQAFTHNLMGRLNG